MQWNLACVAAIFRNLCQVLEELLDNQRNAAGAEDASRPGEKCHADRPKEMLTLFRGPCACRAIIIMRGQEQVGRVPLDRALGLWEGYSPGVLDLVCRAAARFPLRRPPPNSKPLVAASRGPTNAAHRPGHGTEGASGPATTAAFQHDWARFRSATPPSMAPECPWCGRRRTGGPDRQTAGRLSQNSRSQTRLYFYPNHEDRPGRLATARLPVHQLRGRI